MKPPKVIGNFKKTSTPAFKIATVFLPEAVETLSLFCFLVRETDAPEKHFFVVVVLLVSKELSF